MKQAYAGVQGDGTSSRPDMSQHRGTDIQPLRQGDVREPPLSLDRLDLLDPPLVHISSPLDNRST
jgi:hypothetical protein